jgi:RNA polymerase sigma factor (sigma-70 family)
LRDEPTIPVALIQRAILREREAERLLVEALTPSIRASVARVLRRRARARGGAGPDVEDLTQSVLLLLFADGGRVLLSWDPGRGLPLQGFVALVARRRAVAMLRSPRLSPRREEPTEAQVLDEHAAETTGPESATFSRQAYAAAAETAHARLSPRGAALFELLYLRGCSTAQVCALEGISASAVYAWRARLSRLASRIAAELAPMVEDG